jgi:hypothetical protein
MVRHPSKLSLAAVARLHFEFYPVGGGTTIGSTRLLHHLIIASLVVIVPLSSGVSAHIPRICGTVDGWGVPFPDLVKPAPSLVVGIRCTTCQVTCLNLEGHIM